LRRRQLASSVLRPEVLQAALNVGVLRFLIPTQPVFADEHRLHRHVLGFFVQYNRQLVEVQLSVSCLSVEPVVPALDVVVRPYRRLERRPGTGWPQPAAQPRVSKVVDERCDSSVHVSGQSTDQFLEGWLDVFGRQERQRHDAATSQVRINHLLFRKNFYVQNISQHDKCCHLLKFAFAH